MCYIKPLHKILQRLSGASKLQACRYDFLCSIIQEKMFHSFWPEMDYLNAVTEL